MDKKHTEESTQLHHMESPHIESSRPKEERKTKGHNKPKNGNRHEQNEQKLDKTRRECPVKSELENAPLETTGVIK